MSIIMSVKMLSL